VGIPLLHIVVKAMEIGAGLGGLVGLVVGCVREFNRLALGAASFNRSLPPFDGLLGAAVGGCVVFAEFEREILCERVRAGIAQARKEGRRHGRPPTAALKGDEIRRLKAERLSHSEIARRLGIGRTSVRRVLAAS
jgi:hypothetical protein